MNCLPFIVSLIINIGLITSSVVELSDIRRCKTICGEANRRNNAKLFINNIIYSLMIIALVYVLCSRGHNRWAWFVVLFPFVLSLIYLIALMFNPNLLLV